MKFAKQKVRIWTLKTKDDNKITNKAVPLKTRRSLEAANTLSWGAFLWKCKLKFGRKRGRGESFLQRELSIYRGEGAVSRTRLDSTVARFPEDACPLRRSEGDVFLLKFNDFHGIGSLQSTRFPEGLVLGNSGKNCYPRNVEFDEIHEMSFQGGWLYEDLKSWICEALKSRSCEDLESWICEALKLRSCEDLESWLCEALKSWSCEDLESWVCEALKSRSCEDMESRICEALKSRSCENLESWICEALKSWVHEDTESWTCETSELGIYEIRESTEIRIRRLRRMKVSMNKRLMNQLEAKSKTPPQKSGFDVWTSGRLVNVWN
jgi:hypothetical protein